MEYINREESTIGHTKDLEDLYTFENFPVFMGCSKNPEDTDIKADMCWAISKSTGLIQLKKLLPLDILYPESHGAGCVGGLWAQHHKAFTDFIYTFKLNTVFEIGGSHGILAKNYNELQKCDWTIIEPNPAPIEGTPAKFIKGFFDDSFQYSQPFDAVVHSHVFEHIYEPDTFMLHLSNFIPEGKKLLFSVPNMQIMLDRKYTNCINFEHTIFLTEPYIHYLLAKHGFRFLEKEYFMDDHSIFYIAEKNVSVEPVKLPSDLFEKNKSAYLDYIAYHKNLIKELNEKMFSTNKPIYLFGAHVFAQYLIAFGLDTSMIINLLDNDINKHDKRLYGTSLVVKSPKILKEIDSPIVILKAGVYNAEIKKDILENINTNTIFWE